MTTVEPEPADHTTDESAAGWPEGSDLTACLDRALADLDARLAALPHGAPWLVYKRVLVVDPPPDLLLPVLLQALGARVSVAGPPPPGPAAPRREALYRALLARLAVERPQVDPWPVFSVLEQGGFGSVSFRALPGTLAELAADGTESFDLVLTDGLLADAPDPAEALGQVASVLRPAGYAVHHVSFGDPRRPEAPLEFLTEAPEAFEARRVAAGGGCGTRWRLSGFSVAMEGAGFAVLGFEPTETASGAYLDGLEPRLHPAHATFGRESLRPLAGLITARRTTLPEREYPTEDDDRQTLAHSAARYAVAEPWVKGREVLDLGCGAGLGTRRLLAAGARGVLGLDRRPEALDLARAADPRGAAARDAFLLHDLGLPLPLDDASVDVVVALEVLEHVEAQARLVYEIHRVLRPDGVAFLSVPHAPFERFWADEAGEPNPFHVHVPELDEFLRLLAPFAHVDVLGQVDLAASVVLPLGEPDGRLVEGTLQLDVAHEPSDLGTVTLLARCHRGPAPDRARDPGPRAFAFGNHQQACGRVLTRNRQLDRLVETFAADLKRAENAAYWRDLAERGWI